MFVRIHKTSNMPGIRNHKGSSAMLITYLRDKCMASEESVSYTHLTLPTILRV